MATTDKRISVSELDFDGIKENLKTFLKNQNEFTDYDFEGSGMNILLDVLSYNTHYSAMNVNLAANEMFIDSASLRSSVVSHAKSLGYLPRSARSPIAVVDITINDTSVTTATMPRGTKFTTTINNQNYNFFTISDLTQSRVSNVLTFSNVDLYEGDLITTRYTVDTTNIDQKYIIPSTDVDTTTLKVTVQNSSTDATTTVYTLNEDITQVTGTSNVYFLQEVDNGQYEVYFGDGVLGKSLTDSNIVILEYIVTNRTEGNGASVFTPPASISGSSDNSILTVDSAKGGSEKESIASIKFKAPLDFASQGRAVTVNDYKVFVPTVFPDAESVQVWGGEDNDPPTYGKVFISILTKDRNDLTNSQKANINESLKQYNVGSIRTEITNPETIFIRLTVNFDYNSTITNSSAADLEALVNTTINDYNNNNLKQFNSNFRYSELLTLIDNTDQSIISNITTVQMAKNFTPTLNETTKYEINFANAIYNPHSGHESVISSTGFKIEGNANELFLDDNNGTLRSYFLVGTTRTYVDLNFGSVNYDLGLITIPSAKITSISNVDGSESTTVRVVAIPRSSDIIPLRNTILEIDLSNSTIGSKVDTTISSSGSAATTTSAAVTTASTSSRYITTGASSSSGY
tara:strand:+ start:2343 stop:4241 length:1899 start_codon:yes stop_codon:yes gene_type:complete